MPFDASPPRGLDAGQPETEHLGCSRMWIVAQTNPQAERWAQANLQRSGYPTFLPLMLASRRDPVLKSVTRTVEVPLFAGYLFVVCGPDDPWVPVRYTPGVARLVGRKGGKPHYARAGV